MPTREKPIKTAWDCIKWEIAGCAFMAAFALYNKGLLTQAIQNDNSSMMFSIRTGVDFFNMNNGIANDATLFMLIGTVGSLLTAYRIQNKLSKIPVLEAEQPAITPSNRPSSTPSP